MSLNRLLPDQPEPEIAGSATLLGGIHVGAGAIVSQGTVVRSHDDAVSIGNHSAVLENGAVVGTREHPCGSASAPCSGTGHRSSARPSGTSAKSATALAQAPGRPSWTLPRDAVDVIRRIDR
jgi:hypothetical protein